jgi:hypothetical protein
MVDFTSPFTDEHLQTLMGVGMIVWILLGMIRIVQTIIPNHKRKDL